MNQRHKPNEDQAPPPAWDYDEQLQREIEQYEQEMNEEDDPNDY